MNHVYLTTQQYKNIYQSQTVARGGLTLKMPQADSRKQDDHYFKYYNTNLIIYATYINTQKTKQKHKIKEIHDK